MQLIIATKNNGKTKEIGQILPDVEMFSLADLNYLQDIEENGKSFYENALIKAKKSHDLFHNDYPDAYFLADDSGLEIDVMGGKPGIFSARYAGEGATQEMLIRKVLYELRDIPFEKRNASFVCSMILFTPDKNIFNSEGRCDGIIGFQPAGTNGFGYDPIFLIKEFNYKKAMAEISDREKNSISHRKMALNGITEIINNINRSNK
jgi:XTP/dITP diphosphohydrolase